MARITVEDCLSKIDSQYDLVLLAKERASQLNAGEKSMVEENRDKNSVIALREIGEGKISLKTIEDSAINKLRKIKIQPKELEELGELADSSFLPQPLKIISVNRTAITEIFEIFITSIRRFG